MITFDTHEYRIRLQQHLFISLYFIILRFERNEERDIIIVFSDTQYNVISIKRVLTFQPIPSKSQCLYRLLFHIFSVSFGFFDTTKITEHRVPIKRLRIIICHIFERIVVINDSITRKNVQKSNMKEKKTYFEKYRIPKTFIELAWL